MRPGEGRTDSSTIIGRQSLKERWVRLRNRILSDAAVTRWAAAFPLTRPIARRRARGIFDLVAGFVYSQATTAALETGLVAFLARGGATVEEFAAVSGLPSEAARRLNLSQPALSRQIMALEDSLGAKLFHRHARGLALTNEGEQLYAMT
ncbi:MAG: LysR family transcriptional regulator, partial [Thermaurantiacus sp.]